MTKIYEKKREFFKKNLTGEGGIAIIKLNEVIIFTLFWVDKI